jgi:hypothetical protein
MATVVAVIDPETAAKILQQHVGVKHSAGKALYFFYALNRDCCSRFDQDVSIKTNSGKETSG